MSLLKSNQKQNKKKSEEIDKDGERTKVRREVFDFLIS